jgi:hypothetical protein
MDVLGYQFFSMDNNGNRGREAAMCVYVRAREKLSYQVDNFARETINNDLYVSVRAVVQRSRRVWKRLLGSTSTEDIRVGRRLGGESASQHPPRTMKLCRLCRACVRAVSVMSVRNEKVSRRGCIVYLIAREVISFILWKYCIFDVEVNANVKSK